MYRWQVFITVSVCLIVSIKLQAQLNIAWSQEFGEIIVSDQLPESATKLDNNNILITGRRSKIGNVNDFDMLHFIIDEQGNTLTSTRLAGKGTDSFYDAVALSDGGFVTVGTTDTSDTLFLSQNDGEVISTYPLSLYGSRTVVVARWQANGNLLWLQTYGGDDTDWVKALTKNNNNQLFLTGYTQSYTGDFGSDLNLKNLWVARISLADGHLDWVRIYGGSGNEEGRDISFSANASQLAVCGYTSSANGDVATAYGSRDVWWLIIDPETGDLLQEKTFGGSSGDSGVALAALPNGDWAITASTFSSDGHVSENFGNDDTWLLRISPTGQIQWASVFGELSSDEPRKMVYAPDNSLLVVGDRFDPNLVANSAYDVTVIKFNSESGEFIQRYIYGGTGWEFGNAATLDAQHRLIVSANTDSEDGDLEGLLPTPYNGTRPVQTPTYRHGTHTIWTFALDVVSSISCPTPIQNTTFNCTWQANHQLYIHFAPNTPLLQASQITIYDILGRIIAQQTIPPNTTSHNINLPTALNSGIYIAEINYKTCRFTIY